MTLRTGHGTGAGVPRVEVLPADEQPAPVAALAPPLVFRPNGQIGDSVTAKALGARGGAARAARSRLTSALGLAELAHDSAFGPYRVAGDDFVRSHLAALTAQAGGDPPGPGPASIVASAGMQLSASRFLSDKGMRDGDAKLLQQASTLANDSRQNLLAAYELAIREAKARRASAPATDPLEKWMTSPENET